MFIQRFDLGTPRCLRIRKLSKFNLKKLYGKIKYNKLQLQLSIVKEIARKDC